MFDACRGSDNVLLGMQVLPSETFLRLRCWLLHLWTWRSHPQLQLPTALVTHKSSMC